MSNIAKAQKKEGTTTTQSKKALTVSGSSQHIDLIPMIYCRKVQTRSKSLQKENGSKIQVPSWIPQELLADLISDFTRLDALNHQPESSETGQKKYIQKKRTTHASSENISHKKSLPKLSKDVINIHQLLSTSISSDSVDSFSISDEDVFDPNSPQRKGNIEVSSVTSIEDMIFVREIVTNVTKKVKEFDFEIDFDLPLLVEKVVKNRDNLTVKFLQKVFEVDDIECSIGKYACYKAVLCLCDR